MYPRNAASPEPIAIGAVVQISDGAVQTSGCTVRIKPIGVAEGDGAGTTAYSTDGIVLYTPTQAETNYTSFIVIAKKTGCIPVSITVVTSASATPGKVVLSGETHTSAVIPTVTTLTGHTPQTGDSFARIGATGSSLTSLAPSSTALSTATWTNALATDIGTTNSLAGGVTGFAAIDAVVDAILDDTGTSGVVVAGASKTGYSLTPVTGLGDQTANITGTVSGNSTLTQTQITGGAYAINSASFAFNAVLDFTTAQKAATLARVTLVDTTSILTGHTVQTGDSYAIVSSGIHGNAAIKGYVDDIGVAGAGLTALGDTRLANLDATVSSRSSHTAANVVTAMGTGAFLTAIPWNAAWDAEVQSEVQDAIEINHLDHLLAADYDPASKPGVSTALLNELVGDDTGVSQFTANALELAPTGGSAPTVAQIRAEIDSNSTQLAAIVGDTNELQTDWVNGGRLDLILDARASQSSVDDVPTVSEFTARTLATAEYATAAALTAIDDLLDTEIAAILNQLGGFSGTGVNTILGFLKAIMRADASVPSDAGGTYTSSTDSLEALGTAIAGLSSSLGSGADLCTLRIRETDLTPVADAGVWITTDSAGSNVIAGTRQTNSSGLVTFLLNAGVIYYLWAQKDGWEGIQGTAFTAVAD